eukprot:TRINITY_DN2184_c0_g1_i1.p1 TRINITY_DN2184_c0_g1~~TRINITY_DN2184_c0_g1_i1.p1  ORF type:complete len:173 (+),score=38.97 TRINITY_DN2184_c0_g1_i1:277-795(+)
MKGGTIMDISQDGKVACDADGSTPIFDRSTVKMRKNQSFKIWIETKIKPERRDTLTIGTIGVSEGDKSIKTRGFDKACIGFFCDCHNRSSRKTMGESQKQAKAEKEVAGFHCWEKDREQGKEGKGGRNKEEGEKLKGQRVGGISGSRKSLNRTTTNQEKVKEEKSGEIETGE